MPGGAAVKNALACVVKKNAWRHLGEEHPADVVKNALACVETRL